MNFILPLTPVIIGLIALSISIRARVLKSRKKFPHIVRKSSLSGEEATLGVHALSSYALEVNPDFIVGLNRGGILLGAYISLAIKLPSRYLKRCLITKKELKCMTEDLKGRVLVVDDIVRTGFTMSSAIQEIKSNENVKDIIPIALAASIDKSTKSLPKDLYTTFLTHNNKLLLPWSTHENIDSEDEKNRKKQEEFDVIQDEPFEELISEVISTLPENDKSWFRKNNISNYS